MLQYSQSEVATLFLNRKLIELREEAGITQEELANRINVGRSTISGYENGTTQPSYAVLILLADYFGVNLDYLFGRTDIRMPICRLNENLITRSGTIPIDTLFQLSNDEKEAIGLMLHVLKKRNKK